MEKRTSSEDVRSNAIQEQGLKLKKSTYVKKCILDLVMLQISSSSMLLIPRSSSPLKSKRSGKEAAILFLLSSSSVWRGEKRESFIWISNSSEIEFRSRNAKALFGNRQKKVISSTLCHLNNAKSYFRTNSTRVRKVSWQACWKFSSGDVLAAKPSSGWLNSRPADERGMLRNA